MINTGAILFSENADRNNRFAKIVCDTSLDIDFTIVLNGTDRNGTPVKPRFISVDNFNNANGIDFSVDGFGPSGIAPYTISVIELNPDAQRFSMRATFGIVNVYISEKKLPISPGPKYTQTAVAKFLFLNAGLGSIAIPTDWNSGNNVIHCIAPGNTGTNGTPGPFAGSGGGGGAYASIRNLALSPGAIINCQVGAGNSGNDTWFVSAGTVMAKAPVTRTGGLASASIGTTKYNGGTATDNSASAFAGSGGGGGAGPRGVGGNSSGGSSQTGGTGDAGFTAGGAPGGGNPSAGPNGSYWRQTTDAATAGSGGGGGGSGGGGLSGGAGGQYGAGGGGGLNTGGGAGRDGLIVLEWTP